MKEKAWEEENAKINISGGYPKRDAGIETERKQGVEKGVQAHENAEVANVGLSPIKEEGGEVSKMEAQERDNFTMRIMINEQQEVIR